MGLAVPQTSGLVRKHPLISCREGLLLGTSRRFCDPECSMSDTEIVSADIVPAEGSPAAVDRNANSPQGVPCEACGCPVEPGDRFCPACGCPNPSIAKEETRRGTQRNRFPLFSVARTAAAR